MTTTNFTNGVTLTDAAWFNDVDALVYEGLLLGNVKLGAYYISRAGTNAGLSLDGSNNATLSGTLTVSGGDLTASGGPVLVQGTSGTVGASTTKIDNSSSVARFIGFGVNASTNATIRLLSVRSDGTNSISYDFDGTGATFGGTLTVSVNSSNALTLDRLVSGSADIRFMRLGSPVGYLADNTNGISIFNAAAGEIASFSGSTTVLAGTLTVSGASIAFNGAAGSIALHGIGSFRLERAGAATQYAQLDVNASGVTLYATAASGALNLSTDGASTQHLRIDSAGVISIAQGTITTGSTTALSLATSGGTQVQVTNTASATQYLTLTGATGGDGPTINTSSGHINIRSNAGSIIFNGSDGTRQVEVFHTATADRYITLRGGDADNGGGSGVTNATIGVSGGKLAVSAEVVGASSYQTTASAYFYSSSGGAADALRAGIYMDGTNTLMQFHTNTTERARITEGGFFKASNSGTYQEVTTASFEFCNYDDNAHHAMQIYNGAATTTNQYGLEITLAGDPNDTTRYMLKCVGNATERATIRSNGGLANFQANDANLCDATAKTNIQDAPDYTDQIAQLQYHTFAYKDSPDDETVDITAQDIEEIAPELVGEWSGGLKSVKTYRLQQRINSVIPRLIKRVKELEARLA